MEKYLSIYLNLLQLARSPILVPLIGENRYIVQKGLENCENQITHGYQALCEVSGVKQHEIDEESIGFYFGPRLNAIGRLGDAKPGVEFLMSEDLHTALQWGKIAIIKKIMNEKKYVNSITEEAIAMIENESEY